MASVNADLKRIAKTQLFVLDLRLSAAPSAIAAQLGGPDAKQPVRWRDADSELLVFPADTRVRYARGYVFVELALASDQTGRDTLLFPFRVGASPNEAVAAAVSETQPRGNAVLAARWGHIATPIVWNAVLRAGQALLARRKLAKPLAVSGVYTLGRVLSFLVTEPITADDVRDYFTNVLRDDAIPDLSVLNRRYLGSLPLLRTRTR